MTDLHVESSRQLKPIYFLLRKAPRPGAFPSMYYIKHMRLTDLDTYSSGHSVHNQ